jgi:hypothetical protein
MPSHDPTEPEHASRPVEEHPDRSREAAPAPDAGDEDAKPHQEAPPSRGRQGGAILLLLASLLTLLGAARLGLGIYAPVRAKTAPGETADAGPETPRGRVEVQVRKEMARPGHQLTVTDVVRFYDLEDDAVACTVRERHGLALGDHSIPELAREGLTVGDKITICLD